MGDTVDMVLVTVMEVSITEVTTVITWASVLLKLILNPIMVTMVMVVSTVDTVLDTVSTTEVTTVTTWASVLLILNLTILVTDMVMPVTLTVMVVMVVTTGAKLTDQNLPFLTPKHFF